MGQIRLGVAILSGRIFAGYPNKKGDGFREPRHDVTSDVLKVVAEYVGMNHEITVQADGKPAYTVAVKEIKPAATTAAT